MNHIFSLFDLIKFLKRLCFPIIKFEKKRLSLFVLCTFDTFFWHIIKIKIKIRDSVNPLTRGLDGLSKIIDFV